MDKKLQNNVFSKLNQIDDHLKMLEDRLDSIEKHFEEALKTVQAHVVRVKNGETLADDFVLNRRKYCDLSPERAYRLYQDKDRDFILLDVSQKEYSPEKELPEAMKIPLEELGIRYGEIVNKAASVFVISEDGTRSILACELLNRKGYLNINNVSGGYKFWPSIRGLVEDSDRDDQLQSA